MTDDERALLIYVAKIAYVTGVGGAKIDTDPNELPYAMRFVELLRRVDPTYTPPKGLSPDELYKPKKGRWWQL